MDLLAVMLSQTDQGMRFDIQFAADPRTVDGVIYYYWFSFDDAPDASAGNPPTWTIQGDASYSRIVSMYYEERHVYSGAWNETTLSFTIPWDDLRAEYGDSWPVVLGAPAATSAGPYTGIQNMVDYAAGLATANDWADNGRDERGMSICPQYA